MREAVSALAIVGASVFAALAAAAEYAPVTDARLTNPAPENWLMYRRTYDSQGYSPLDQINAENVAGLKPLWTFSTGMREGHQAPPVVNDGAMFVTTPNNHLLALDAASGKQRWRYQRDLPEDLSQMHPTNRGVGALRQPRVHGHRRIASSSPSMPPAVRRGVGSRRSKTTPRGYYMTLAPLVADGKVMVGRLRRRVGHPRLRRCAGRRARATNFGVEGLHHSGARRTGTAKPGKAIRGRPAACRSG